MGCIKMNKEARNLIEEEEKENNSYYSDWFSDNRAYLESEFINKFPPEEQPLDDDIPDFLDRHYDKFEKYCYQMYKNRRD